MRYSGWVTTYKVGYRDFVNEESLDEQIKELGYNIFLSEDEANECLQKILKIYDDYNNK